MIKIKEILRLKKQQLSQHQIARSLNLSVGAVHKYLHLAQKAGVHWPLPEDMKESQLRSLLMPKKDSCVNFSEIDYEWMHRDLKNKGVTLKLLHEEYCEKHPGHHYSYRQFCALYKSWRKTQNVTLRQEHKAGDKMFSDYAGLTIPIIVNRKTKETKDAQIFVAVLGASNFTFCEATWSQKLEQWIGSHVRAFQYFGGIPHLIVPDNLKSAVSQACYYDPDLNPSYAEMAEHYNCAIMPARPYKPKDKAKVETGVQVVERWILARLRHETFYSIEDLNKKIKELLEEVNNKPFNKLEGTRRSVFEAVDKPALKPLPEKPYEFARIHKRKVGTDYHFCHEGHFYSVPYLYAGQSIYVRETEKVLEVLSDGQRITSHVRSKNKGTTTLLIHMPYKHLQHTQWSPEKALNWAQSKGPSVVRFFDEVIAKKKHQEQIRRFCLGFLRLEKEFGKERLDKACHRALYYKAHSFKIISNILENNMDLESFEQTASSDLQFMRHNNIRGASYYSGGKLLC